MDTINRKCKICKVEKLISEFQKYGIYFSHKCKSCMNEITRNYRNTEKFKAKHAFKTSITGTKKCIDCGIEKNLKDFHKHNTNKDGRFNRCKPCHHENVKLWKEKNKEKIPAYSRTSNLRHLYKLTVAEYDEMVKLQNNKCKICGEEPRKTKDFQTWRLHVDHCHKTKKIRGLLCHLCNRGLGLFKERCEILENAIKYLKISS